MIINRESKPFYLGFIITQSVQHELYWEGSSMRRHRRRATNYQLFSFELGAFVFSLYAFSFEL